MTCYKRTLSALTVAKGSKQPELSAWAIRAIVTAGDPDPLAPRTLYAVLGTLKRRGLVETRVAPGEDGRRELVLYRLVRPCA